MGKKRLLEFCAAWGVKVEHCTRSKRMLDLPSYENGHRRYTYDGPVTGAICFLDEFKRSSATIYFPVQDTMYPEDNWALLHELNHVIQAELTGRPPVAHNEMRSSMLAFEWFAGKWLGLRHKASWWNSYGTPDPFGRAPSQFWRVAPAQWKKILLKESFQLALEQKLLLPSGEPCINFNPINK